MAFDCPNRKECEEMGVLVEEECIAYCGIYETHRVKQLEQVAKRMLDFIERVEQTAYDEFSDQLRDCGVSLDD